MYSWEEVSLQFSYSDILVTSWLYIFIKSKVFSCACLEKTLPLPLTFISNNYQSLVLCLLKVSFMLLNEKVAICFCLRKLYSAELTWLLTVRGKRSFTERLIIIKPKKWILFYPYSVYLKITYQIFYILYTITTYNWRQMAWRLLVRLWFGTIFCETNGKKLRGQYWNCLQCLFIRKGSLLNFSSKGRKTLCNLYYPLIKIHSLY